MGKKTVEFGGTTYTSAPLVDGEEINAEQRVFKRAIAKEKKAITERKQLTNPPTLQDVRSIQVHTMTFSQRFSSYWTSYWLSRWKQLPLNVQIKLVKTRL